MKYSSLFNIWKNVCKKYSDNIAFFDNEEKTIITYENAFREVCYLSEKFQEYGLERNNRVAMFTNNSPRWLIMEQAVINLGGVCVAKFPEISLQELDYVYQNSEATVLITDSTNIINYFIEKNTNFLNDVKFILYTGNEEPVSHSKIYKLEDIIKDLYDNSNIKIKYDWADYPDDIAYISYTSGTSSEPKGAMLKNIGMAYIIEQLEEIKETREKETALCTCHISSMGWKAENLLYWACGCKTVYTHYKDFYETIEKFRPKYFEIPPKILQTIYNKLTDKLQQQNPIYRIIFKTALKIADFIRISEQKNIKNALFEKITNFLDKKIFKKLRNTMFNDEVVFDVGSAPLPQKLEDFYQNIGIRIIQSYGATETTGIFTGNTIKNQRLHPYTVGRALKYNEVKIVNPETFEEITDGKPGLLLLKGPTILQGYCKNEEATKEAFVEDNYYRTGDLAIMDKEGFLTILSRYDDVLVMLNGYNIYTRLLENEIKDSEYIKQFIVAGHGKAYLTALVVINKEKCKDIPDLKNFLLKHINEKIRKKNNYRYYEKIRDIYICQEDFTVQNGLLAANTLKTIYKKVYLKYKKEIENMY